MCWRVAGLSSGSGCWGMAARRLNHCLGICSSVRYRRWGILVILMFLRSFAVVCGTQARKKALVPNSSGTKACNLCGATRIDLYPTHRPTRFRVSNNTRSPDNGWSPRRATGPAKAPRCALESPFARPPPAAFPPSAAL